MSSAKAHKHDTSKWQLGGSAWAGAWKIFAGVGLVAAREDLCQPSADVPGAACDQVAHAAHPTGCTARNAPERTSCPSHFLTCVLPSKHGELQPIRKSGVSVS